MDVHVAQLLRLTVRQRFRAIPGPKTDIERLATVCQQKQVVRYGEAYRDSAP